MQGPVTETMENLSFCSFEPRSHSKLTIRPASSKRPRVSCFGDGPAAAHPPARTSQSVLQAEIEKAHGGLQEHHGEDRDENQHTGVDPVEGIWKAEQRCSPRACTAPGSRAPGLEQEDAAWRESGLVSGTGWRLSRPEIWEPAETLRSGPHGARGRVSLGG